MRRGYNLDASSREMRVQRIHGTSLIVALVTVPLLAVFDPAETWWFPSCPLRALTGWLCPFCGSLRALHALLHGVRGAALTLNPLTTLGVLAGLATLAHDAVAPDRSAQFERVLHLCFSARGVAFLIAFGVFRNLSEPFAWIARYEETTWTHRTSSPPSISVAGAASTSAAPSREAGRSCATTWACSSARQCSVG